MLSQHFCFSLSQKFFLYRLHCCTFFPIQYNYDNPSNYVLYYDPTVESHALEYSIFAAIASSVLVIFIFLPTVLLILYPTRLFRKCASCCGFRRWYALHMFVESFQGQYKDGTNGTRDRLWDGLCLISHPQDTNCGLIYVLTISFSQFVFESVFFVFSIYNICRCSLLLCCHEAIQIKF